MVIAEYKKSLNLSSKLFGGCIVSSLRKNDGIFNKPLLSIGDVLLFGGDLFLEGLYELVLGRSIDSEGLKHYSKLIESGVSRLSIIRDIAGSKEGRIRLDFRELDLVSDEEFITELYRRLLGRDPEPAGRRHYLSVLTHGSSRNDVLNEIVKSEESQKRNPGLYQLRRDLVTLNRRKKIKQGLLSRVFTFFSIGKNVENLRSDIDDLKMEMDFRTTALLSYTSLSAATFHVQGPPPRALDGQIGEMLGASDSPSMPYSDEDIPQTVDEILDRVRTEVAAM